MFKILLILLLISSMTLSYGQERPLRIEDEQQANRLLLYAVNENEQAFDILLTVKGSYFRQPKGKARWIHIPAASRVNVKSLIVERGKQAIYTYEMEVNDSLSRRALKKPFKSIKIEAKKPIILYLTDRCTTCDSLISSLGNSNYLYKTKVLSEHAKTEEYLRKTFDNSTTPFDGVTNAFISLGGKYYGDIGTYDELLERLNEE